MSGTGNERGVAEFNMAVSYLGRLDKLFYITDEAAMTLDINKWMHGLMCIFRELSTEMKDEEIAELKNKFDDINSKVQETNQSYNRKGTMEVSSETYDGLHNIELELRKVLKESGLQMKMKDAADMALH